MQYINKVYYNNEQGLIVNHMLVYVDNGVVVKIEDYKDGKLVSILYENNNVL